MRKVANNIKEVLADIYENNERLYHRLARAGSWRGLFDEHSSEYKGTDIFDKTLLLSDILNFTNLNLERLIEMYESLYIESGRRDIAAAAKPSALYMLNLLLRGLDFKKLFKWRKKKSCTYSSTARFAKRTSPLTATRESSGSGGNGSSSTARNARTRKRSP